MKRKLHLSDQKVAAKRGRALVPMDLIKHIMSFAPFATGWRMAMTNSKLMEFYLQKVWPLVIVAHADLCQQLTQHKFGKLSPSRLYFSLSAHCELCRKGRCSHVKGPWGVFAHGKCIKEAILNEYYVSCSSTELVCGDIQGYNRHTRDAWTATYVWKTRCAAFPDLRTFDGWHVDRFGSTKEEHEENQRRQIQEEEDKWVVDHLAVLSSHPAWPTVGHLRAYWFCPNNLEVCLAKLDEFSETRTKIRQELEGFTGFSSLTDEELLKCHESYARSVVLNRLLRQDLDTLVQGLEFPPPLSASLVRTALSNTNLLEEAVISAVKTRNEAQLKVLCERMVRTNVRNRMRASFERWMWNRDFDREQVWRDAELDPTIFVAMLDPNMQFENLPNLQALEERYPKTPQPRSHNIERICACGNLFSNQCEHNRCGRCCTGPCQKHDGVIAKRHKQ